MSLDAYLIRLGEEREKTAAADRLGRELGLSGMSTDFLMKLAESGPPGPGGPPPMMDAGPPPGPAAMGAIPPTPGAELEEVGTLPEDIGAAVGAALKVIKDKQDVQKQEAAAAMDQQAALEEQAMMASQPPPLETPPTFPPGQEPQAGPPPQPPAAAPAAGGGAPPAPPGVKTASICLTRPTVKTAAKQQGSLKGEALDSVKGFKRSLSTSNEERKIMTRAALGGLAGSKTLGAAGAMSGTRGGTRVGTGTGQIIGSLAGEVAGKRFGGGAGARIGRSIGGSAGALAGRRGLAPKGVRQTSTGRKVQKLEQKLQSNKMKAHDKGRISELRQEIKDFRKQAMEDSTKAMLGLPVAGTALGGLLGAAGGFRGIEPAAGKILPAAAEALPAMGRGALRTGVGGAAVGTAAAGLIGIGKLLNKADPSGNTLEAAIQLAPAVIAAGGAMADSRTKMAFKEDWSHLPAHLQKNEAFKPMEGEDIKKTHRSLGVRVGGMLGGAGLSGAGVGAGMSGKPRTALALGAAGVGTTLGSMALGSKMEPENLKLRQKLLKKEYGSAQGHVKALQEYRKSQEKKAAPSGKAIAAAQTKTASRKSVALGVASGIGGGGAVGGVIGSNRGRRKGQGEGLRVGYSIGARKGYQAGQQDILQRLQQRQAQVNQLRSAYEAGKNSAGPKKPGSK